MIQFDKKQRFELVIFEVKDEFSVRKDDILVNVKPFTLEDGAVITIIRPIKPDED